MSVPTAESLRASIGGRYLLTGDWPGELPLELVEVIDGMPMNRRHHCYIACFALPSGVALPQLNGDLHRGGDTWPGLLLTPTVPDEQGRASMQVVFHCVIAQAAAETSATA